MSASVALQPNPCFLQTPQADAKVAHRKAFIYKTLERITMVAILAIAVGVFALSYSGVVLSQAATIGACAVVLSTIGLAALMGSLHKWAADEKKIGDREEAVSKNLTKILHFKESDVKNFLHHRNIDPETINIDVLKQINPKRPLLALLPVIARYNYLQDQIVQVETSMQNQIDSADKIDINKATPIERRNRLMLKEMAHQIKEEKLFPTLFQAALLLEIMQNPASKITFPTLGDFTIKSLAERLLDQKENTNDLYFRSKNNNKELSFKEVEHLNLRPHVLRGAIF